MAWHRWYVQLTLLFAICSISGMKLLLDHSSTSNVANSHDTVGNSGSCFPLERTFC